MKVKCAECGKRYKIQDSLVSPQGIRIRCPNCNFIFPVYPESFHGDGIDETTENTSNLSSETTPYSETEVDGFAEEEQELSERDLHSDPNANLEATHIQEEEPSDPFANVPSTQTAFNREQAESSFPAEISQVSFNSDISFDDEISNNDREIETPSQQVSANPDSQPNAAKTAINPNLPPRVSAHDIPPPRHSPQTPSMAQVRATQVEPPRKSAKWLWLLLILGMIGGIYYGVRAGIIDLNKLTTPKAPVAVNPVKTQVAPTPKVVRNPIPAEETREIKAAISFLSKDSLDYACTRLSRYLPNKIVAADLSYCLALKKLFFDNESVKTEVNKHLQGLKAVPEVQLKAAVADAILSATQKPAFFDQTLSGWDISNDEKKDADYTFVLAVGRFLQNDFVQAREQINLSLRRYPNFGPYLALEQWINSKEKGKKSGDISKALVGTRNQLLRKYPTFQVFLPSEVVPVKRKPKRKTPRTKPRKKPRKSVQPTKKSPPKPVVPAPQPKDPRKSLIELGDQQFKGEQFSQALKSYQAAQKLGDSEDPSLLTRLGNTWFKLYRLDEAFAAYGKALELDPNQANAHKGLGRVYDHLGDADQAIREFSIYLQLNPKAKDAAIIKRELKKLKQ